MGRILVSFKEAKLGPSSGSREDIGDSDSDGHYGERSSTPATLPSNPCQRLTRKQPGSLKKQPRLAAHSASTTPLCPISTDMDWQPQRAGSAGSNHFQAVEQPLLGATLQGNSVAAGVCQFSSSPGVMPPVSNGLGFDNGWSSFGYNGYDSTCTTPSASDLQGAPVPGLDLSTEIFDFLQG